MEPVDLPDAAADPVPGHSAAHLFAYRQAQPVLHASVFPTVEGQIGRSRALSLVVKALEFMISFDGDGKLQKRYPTFGH